VIGVAPGIIHEINAATNGGGGATISLDPDPNTTAPPATRRFVGKIAASGDFGIYAYALPVANAITLRIWLRDPQLDRWFAIGAAVACPGDQTTILAIPAGAVRPSIPSGAELFVQVTANGAGCVRAGIGFFEG
jgi:hypothetical protein